MRQTHKTRLGAALLQCPLPALCRTICLRLAPTALLVGVASAIYCLFFFLNGNDSFLGHSYADNYSRQALAWLSGRLHLLETFPYLELIEVEGVIHNSFPPGPALLHLLPVAIMGQNDPSFALLFGVLLVQIFLIFDLARRFELSLISGGLLAIGLTFGTNIAWTTVSGGPSFEAQNIGLMFALLSLYFLINPNRPSRINSVLGFIFLSLAVSCRPLYLLMYPIFFMFDGNRKQTSLWQHLVLTGAAMVPVGVALAAHNYARFGDPFEFGHRYLPMIAKQGGYIFHSDYFLRNLRFIFLELPSLSTDGKGLLKFNPMGSAFWLGNPVITFCFILGMLSLRSHGWKLLLAWLIGWLPFWFHESNGWVQYNYRFMIDFIPIALLTLLYSDQIRKVDWRILLPLALVGVVFNYLGTDWILNHKTTQEVLDSYQYYWIRVP